MSDGSYESQLFNKLEKAVEDYLAYAEKGPWELLDSIRDQIPGLPEAERLIWYPLLQEIETYLGGHMRGNCSALTTLCSRLPYVADPARRAKLQATIEALDDGYIADMYGMRADLRDLTDEYELCLEDPNAQGALSEFMDAIEHHKHQAARDLWEQYRPYLAPGASPFPSREAIAFSQSGVSSNPHAGGNGELPTSVEDGPCEGVGYWCDGKQFELSRKQQLAFEFMWKKNHPVQELDFMEAVWRCETSPGNLRKFVSTFNDKISENGPPMIMELYRRNGFIYRK